MSRLQRIRKQAMSLRGGIAVAGALAAAVSLTQVAGTMAAPDLEWTAKVPIATANYYPTPLTASVTCETTYTGLLPGRRAKVSWEAVPGATGYRVDLVHSNTGEVKSEFVPAPTTQLPDVVAPYSTAFPVANWAYSIRVRTINGPAMSSGYTTAPERAESKSTITDRTECDGSSGPSVENMGWEDNQSWSPEVESFGIGQPLVNALRGVSAEADGIEDELAAAATLDDAAAEPSTAEAPEAKSAETTTAATGTSTSVPRTSSSTAPTTAPAERSTSSSSSTSAPPSSKATSPSPSTTRASSSAAATPTAPSTTRAAATSTTVPVTSTSTTEAMTVTPVALPGGGEAKLVGGTTLVVSDDDGPVCSATVREGSTLKVRSGVLEVTDTRETREVDPQTCELT